MPVTRHAGGLLHHRFTLTSAGKPVKAVSSLWHCPAGHPGWLLATTLPFEVRTFLDTHLNGDCRGRPAGSSAEGKRRASRATDYTAANLTVRVTGSATVNRTVTRWPSSSPSPTASARTGGSASCTMQDSLRRCTTTAS